MKLPALLASLTLATLVAVPAQAGALTFTAVKALGAFVSLNPQPIPPKEAFVALNPQPIPPKEGFVSLNPQPIPPKEPVRIR